MKVAKVAVSLPAELIAQIDLERRSSRTTRSAYFRKVLERHLRESSHAALTDAYIRGYTEHPETEARVAAADAAAVEAMRELDWE
jgi:metal-responsive CopG/Arc/MetJ family transcriptional regulator